MLSIAILVSFLFAIPPTEGYCAEQSQAKISPYTTMLLNQWKASKTGEAKNFARYKKSLSSVSGQDVLSAFVKVANENGWLVLEEAGCQIQTRTSRIATVQIPMSQLEVLSQSPDIAYIQGALPYRKTMDVVQTALNVAPVLAGTDLPHAYTGKGVVVGIVDGGFDFASPNFYDAALKNSRVLSVWNQNAKTGTRPAGYNYGAEYTTLSQMTTARTDDTGETHGNHVAGIAAGTGHTTPFKGMAPESDLILVGLDWNKDTGVLDGVQYVVDRAKALDKACSINLSLGQHVGPHDGTSLFDQMIDEITGEGVIVVGAAGNEGEDELYVEKTYNPVAKADTLLQTFLVPYSYDPAGIVDIWGDVNTPFSVSIQIYNLSSKKFVDSTAYFSATSQDYYIKTLKSSTGSNAYSVSMTPQYYAENGKYNIFVDITGNGLSSTKDIITFKVVNKSGTVRMWAEYYSTFSNKGQGAKYTNGQTSHTVGEIGGTAKNIISVGAYCTKLSWKNLSGQTLGQDGTMNDIAPFSSMGPTADGRIKPDITAPGHGVVSSYSSYPTYTTDDKAMFVQKVTFNGRTYNWGMMSGTSMASPVITGAMALWLQADPTLTPAEIKEVFQSTSMHKNNMSYPNNIWGAGVIDVKKGITEVINRFVNGMDSQKLSHDGMLIYPNPASDQVHLRWQNVPDQFRILVYDLSNRLIYSHEVAGNQQNDFEWNLSEIGAGLYMVQVQTATEIYSSKLYVK